MGIVIDIIILAICLTIVVKAYRAGVVKAAAGLARGIVSFFAAYAFSPMVGDYLYKNYILDWMSDGIEKSIRSISSVEEGVYDLSSMFKSMPDALRQIIDRYGANEDTLEQMCSGVTDGTEQTVSTVAEYIAQPAADMVSGAVAFFGTFLAVFVAVSLLVFLIDCIFKLPILKGTNRFLGLLFGLAEAAIFAVLISSAVAVAMEGLSGVNPELFGSQVIYGSILMKTCSSLDLFGLLDGVAS